MLKLCRKCQELGVLVVEDVDDSTERDTGG